MNASSYTRWFKDIRLEDVPLVGGKTASLGELYSALSPQGVRVPNGFALTASAYRDALTQAGAWDKLRSLFPRSTNGASRIWPGAPGRRAPLSLRLPTGKICAARSARPIDSLNSEYGANVAVAVRSSATAEDLPTASFAGQHDSYPQYSRCRRSFRPRAGSCFASLFTDRAISYRIDSGFDHFKVALSVAVMKMVRSDLAASGVIFTLDTKSGFRDVVFVTGCLWSW